MVEGPRPSGSLGGPAVPYAGPGRQPQVQRRALRRYAHQARRTPGRRVHLSGPQLGVYWDPLSYTAWQLTVEAGHIAPLVGSFVRQVRLGGGIHQSIFPEVYEVNGSTVTPLGMATRSFGAASTTLGVGYERGPNILWLNLHGLVLVNYNTTVLPMAAAEVSYQFTLNSSRR